MNRLLLVEDDPAIAKLIDLHLHAPDYQVTVCDRGTPALEQLQKERFDLVILDILLPDVGGVDICRHIRAAKNWTPVLMLSALSDESDKVQALESGADDYMTKPFGVAELMARVRALLRRRPATETKTAERDAAAPAGTIGTDAATPGTDAAETIETNAAPAGTNTAKVGTNTAETIETNTAKVETNAAPAATPGTAAAPAGTSAATPERDPATAEKGETRGVIRFRNLMIDRDNRKVTLHGKRLELTPKEFDLLWLLAGHPGKTFSRHDLLEIIWGFAFQEYEHTVTSHINRLRIKIEANLDKPEYILTTWGAGYRFAE